MVGTIVVGRRLLAVVWLAENPPLLFFYEQRYRPSIYADRQIQKPTIAIVTTMMFAAAVVGYYWAERYSVSRCYRWRVGDPAR